VDELFKAAKDVPGGRNEDAADENDQSDDND
jgi:hypothetical protein